MSYPAPSIVSKSKTDLALALAKYDSAGCRSSYPAAGGDRVIASGVAMIFLFGNCEAFYGGAPMKRSLGVAIVQVVSGTDLREWNGRQFRFQDVVFEGSQECTPCEWMDRVVAPGTREFMKKNFRGGLRAKVVTSGTLRVLPSTV